MKVIGTGSPEVLTIRFERCELELLDAELRRRRRLATEKAHRAYKQDAGNGDAERKAQDGHDDLAEVSRVMEQLDDAVIGYPEAPADADGPVELLAATSFWVPVINHAAAEAGERLLDALERFRDKHEHCTAAQLAAAVKTAGAWAETLVTCHHVDGYGTEALL